MKNRITIEISEYPHEILKRTIEEINKVSPLKLSKKQVTDLILFFGCSFIHEKIIPLIKETVSKDKQISLVWPLLSEVGKDPDRLFDVMGQFIMNYRPNTDQKALKQGIKVLKELYDAWSS